METEPLVLTTGGIVSNAGITMARLGMRVAAFTYLGDDEWAEVVRRRFAGEGIDTSALETRSERATSTSAVLIDASGERSFAHYAGAPRLLDKQALLGQLELFARSRAMLIGYYPLMTQLQNDLPEVLAAIRETGCLTAMDAAGDGGTMEPLARILPQLDFYFPSEVEARNQTGCATVDAMIEAFRAAGARGWLGIKMGERGAVVSPPSGEVIEISPVKPPGPVVDTTGAGDCFYAGLITGVLRGLSPVNCGKLAAATGACCVTGLGATTAIGSYDETANLAGVSV
jgi:sugar/nucleoside kinase (ribokinase family)